MISWRSILDEKQNSEIHFPPALEASPPTFPGAPGGAI